MRSVKWGLQASRMPVRVVGSILAGMHMAPRPWRACQAAAGLFCADFLTPKAVHSAHGLEAQGLLL